MITLDSIRSENASIAIASSTGQELAMDGSGFITSNINGTVTVSAADLDIRNLLFATDKVDASGSEVSLDAGTLAALETINAVQSGTWDIGTVTTLTGITNDVNIADGGNSITVDAVQLDIDDLAFGTDSVTAHQGGSWSFTLDNISSWKSTAHAASDSVTEIASTPFAGRNKMIIQNLGNKDVFLGPDNAVTISTGILLPRGSSMDMPFDTGANIWVIADTGDTANLRVAELSN